MAYYYPRLSRHDFGFFRVGGPGLANCMFFAANAYIAAKRGNGKFIEPSWFKFSIGPWLRRERDKRLYSNIFKRYGVCGFKKVIVLLGSKLGLVKTVEFSNLGTYFKDLNEEYDAVREYFDLITKETIAKYVMSKDLSNSVAVHIRLGDFSSQMRIPMSWYREIIRNILSVSPKTNILLFSDGSDEELSDLLSITNVKRSFWGNAYADMLAISKCKLLIASDSTFSAWGAFLGRVPIIFSKRHFPEVYSGDVPEYILGENTTLPKGVIDILKL